MHAAATSARPLSRAATIADPDSPRNALTLCARTHAAQVRVRSRCTTAAPKRVTSATKRVTTQHASPFVTDCASRRGGCNSRRFLSMQRPKPVDIGRPLSGFLSQDSREHSHTSGGKRMNKKESVAGWICNRTSTVVVRSGLVSPETECRLKPVFPAGTHSRHSSQRSSLDNHARVRKGLTLLGISVNGSDVYPLDGLLLGDGSSAQKRDLT